jgi:hypothetical protein
MINNPTNETSSNRSDTVEEYLRRLEAGMLSPAESVQAAVRPGAASVGTGRCGTALGKDEYPDENIPVD